MFKPIIGTLIAILFKVYSGGQSTALRYMAIPLRLGSGVYHSLQDNGIGLAPLWGRPYGPGPLRGLPKPLTLPLIRGT